MALILGALVPMFSSVTPAAASVYGPPLAKSQRDGAPPALAAPYAVTITGNFGQTVPLSQGDDGIWRGTVPASPGSYTFRVEAQSNDGTYSLGDGADPNGNDLDVNVDNDATGLAFSFDPSTGEIIGNDYVANLSLSVDGFGEIGLFPTGDDSWEAFVDGVGGDFTYAVLADGTPTDQTGTVTLDAGRIQITLDDRDGSVSTNTVQPGQLTVTVVNADGSSSPGGCYGVFDGNTPVGQACDSDDGSGDGQINISFPNGAPSGTYDLVETFTPNGQEPAEDESVNVGPGQSTIQVDLPGTGGIDQPSDEGTEQPSDDSSNDGQPSESDEASGSRAPRNNDPNATTGTIEITAVDANGDSLAGAGFDVQNETGYYGTFTDEFDGDVDGVVTITDVFPGSNTVYMVVAPGGQDLLPEQTVTVDAGQTVEVEFRYGAASDEPTEEASPSEDASPSADESPSEEASPSDQADDLSTITVETDGPDGDPIGGAAYSLLINGQTYGPFIDDDFDGELQITEVSSGTFTLRMDVPPDGQDTLPDQTFDVVGGTDLTISFTYEGIEDPEASASDSAASDAAIPTEEASPSEEPSPSDESDTTGTIEIRVGDGSGGDVAGAGFDIQNETGYFGTYYDETDGETNGIVTIDDVAVGSTTIYMVVAPQNESLLPEQTVTVDAGQTTEAAFDYEADEPSESPSPSVSPSPSESAAPNGRLVVTVSDGDGNAVPDACFSLIDPNTGNPIDVLNRDGGDIETAVCDDDGDADGDGRVGIFGIPDGTYTLTQTEVAANYTAAADQSVTVLLGASQEIAVVNASAVEVSVTITRQNDAGDLVAGACFQLEREGSDPIGPVCDDGDGDRSDDEPGLVTIENVPVGSYQVVETTTPDGVQPAAAQPLDVTEDGDNAITITSDRIVTFGDLSVVFSVDGDSVAGGCVSVTNEYGEFGPFCDDQFDGIADGNLTIPQVESGENTVTATTIPQGYALADGQANTVTAEVTEGQSVEATFELVATTGTIELTITDDATGDPIPDACVQLAETSGDVAGVAICDNTGNGEDTTDTNDAPGEFTIPDVPAGTYDILLGNLPDNFSGPDAGRGPTVTVVAGESVTAEQEIAPDPSPSPSESPSPSPSVSLSPSISPSPSVSPSPSESASASASPSASGSPSTSASASASASVSPSPSASASVSASATPSPAGEGLISVRLEDQDGNALADLCLTLSQGGQAVTEICDNQDGDGDDTAGTVLFENVPAGNYLITQTGDLPDGQVAIAAVVSQNVTVVAGETIEVLLVISVQDPGDREVSLVVNYTDGSGRQVAGACFTLDGTEICDNDGNDTDGGIGRIRFDGVVPGDYTIAQTEAPDGYELAADIDYTVDANTPVVAIIPVTAVPTPDENGALVISKVDGNGAALAGSCFLLTRSGFQPIRVCDSADGDRDGTITFEDVTPGTWLLREVTTPLGYAPGGSQTIQILAGQTAEATVQNSPRPGRVTFDTVTADGDALAGACYRLTGPTTYEVCDNQDLAGDDGTTRFDSVAPGDYTVEQYVVPTGYETAEVDPIRVAPGSGQRITVTNQILPPPMNAGDLIVLKVDEDGAALPGACFSLRNGSSTIAGPVCDGEDGRNDGTITFNDVAVGDYTLRETNTPSAAYLPAEDSAVTIDIGDPTRVTVMNTPRNGAIRVTVVNPQGQPLAGACFGVVDDGRDAACSDANGRVTFGEIAPGTYAIDQTAVPSGYVASGRINGVVVNPGVTTDVRVVNQRAAPPANAGTVQIATFYCPAGSAGERTVIFDSSDPGPKQLANTAGCNPGDASFTFVRQGGEGGLGQFSIGPDGFYQATVPVATYTLTEVSPDLPGDATASVQIGRNQLTQVVVINYVAPPAPAPAAIDVTSYTCQAGFQGTLYEDFANNCTAASALTNGVTYRISGPVTQRATTGAGGQTGRAVFSGIPAGSYYVEQQITKGQQILYNFCGLDPNAPATKNVGVGVNVAPQAGQTVYCKYFSIPPVVSSTTGAIIVQKYTCPTLNPPAGYDYYANCAAQTAPAQFSIALYSGETKKYTPVTDGSTNVDGLLTFARLTPGTYSLTEAGDGWCYAESDNVNTNGDVVVRPNTASKVFIFNCAPVTGQPNTGVGTTAASVANGMTPELFALASILSLAVAAAWVARRRRLVA